MALLAIILTISGSCSKNSAVPGINEVFIQGMAFSSSTITVTSGTTITWTNKDGVAHTVTSTTGLFDSGSISTNGTYSHLFSTVGTFPYKCTIHPLMTASVIVN
jgi:plastocyanin